MADPTPRLRSAFARSSTLAKALVPLVAFLPLLVACGSDEVPKEGTTRLFIDTDLPTPEVASRLRIDLYREDGTWFDSREVDTAVASAFPASFDLAAPAEGAATIRVRLRVFPAGAVRAYRGERFVPYDQVFAPPPEPDEETPRLFVSGEDRTPETEPLPALAVDRLVTLRADAGKQSVATVVLHGACAGTMANLTTGESCVATARAREALAGATDVTGPSHTNDLREACDGVETGPDRVCVPGGVFVLGDRQAPFVEDSDGFFLDMRTERLVRVPRFLIDRGEITVGRYRALDQQGFRTTRYSPKDNPGALGDDPTKATACTYTETVGDREDHPLNCLPWGSFRQLCRYEGGDLPSEAQWEYVASLAGGPNERSYPWGDREPTCSQAVYARVSALGPEYCALEPALPRARVAEGDTTPLGVRDLGGGLSEFVADGPEAFDGDAWLEQPFTDPRVPNPVDADAAIDDKQRYGLRGGSWISPANALRTTFRLTGSATSPFYGARCVYPAPR